MVAEVAVSVWCRPPTRSAPCTEHSHNCSCKNLAPFRGCLNSRYLPSRLHSIAPMATCMCTAYAHSVSIAMHVNLSAELFCLGCAQVQGLRAAYEDVTLRLPADGSPAAIFARAESFVRLEAELPSGPDAVSPGSVWPLVQSWELEELTYRVVSTVRLV
jgi:hypothetical protein